MPYTKTTWQDRQVEHPNRYNKLSENSTEVVLTPSPGNVLRQGTPISAANMNKIEQGIADATTKAEAAETPAGAQAKANTAETNAKNASAVKQTIPTNGDLNNVIEPGLYNCYDTVANRPVNQTGYFYGVLVTQSPHGRWVQQTAFHHSSNAIHTRRSADSNGNATSWNPWIRILNQDDYNQLFQSVSNGKAAVAAAITDMGVSTAATAEFATMATNIRAIYTGKKFASGSLPNAGEYTYATPALTFTPHVLIVKLEVNFGGNVTTERAVFIANVGDALPTISTAIMAQRDKSATPIELRCTISGGVCTIQQTSGTGMNYIRAAATNSFEAYGA